MHPIDQESRGKPASGAKATVDSDRPWPGLASFGEADSQYFRGREREAEKLLRMLSRGRLTILVGRSGLGKTSLLQAGLFPKIRKQNKSLLPVYIRLDFSDSSAPLNDQVMERVYETAEAQGYQVPERQASWTLWEHFHRSDPEDHFWDQQNRLAVPLLVFDQFEKAFAEDTRAPRDPLAATFLEGLLDLIEGRLPDKVKQRLAENPDDADRFSFHRHHYLVLLSLRESFLPALEGLRDGMTLILQNRLRIEQMNGETALQVVHRRDLISKDVAESVVRQIAASYEGLGKLGAGKQLAELDLQPALLSLFCRELNNSRLTRGEPMITRELLREQSRQILEDFYEDSFRGLEKAEQVRLFVEDKLLTKRRFRSQFPEQEALADLQIPAESLNKLVERRLIHREKRKDTDWIELTHDVLTQVVGESRDRRASKRAAEEAQRQAQEAQRREQEAQQRAHEAARQAKRNLMWAGILAILLLITIAATLEAWRAREEAQAAQKLAEIRMYEAQAARAEALGNKQEAARFRALAKQTADQAKLSKSAALQDIESKEEELRRLRARAERAEGERDLARSEAAKASSELAELSISAALQDQDIESKEEELRRLRSRARRAEGERDLARSELAKSRSELNETQKALEIEGDDVNEARKQFDYLQLVRKSVDLANASLDKLRNGDGQLSLLLALYATNACLLRGEPMPLQLHEAILMAAGPERSFSDGGLQAVPSPNGRLLAVSGRIDSGGISRIIDFSTGQSTPAFNGEPTIHSWAFSPDSAVAAGGDSKGKVHVYNIAQGRETLSFKAHSSIVKSLSYNRDGTRLATAGLDKRLFIWDADSGRRLERLRGHQGEVYAVAYSPDGKALASGGADGIVKIWNAAGNTLQTDLAAHGEVFCLAFSSDGKRLATGGSDGKARVWDIPSGQELKSFPLVEGSVLSVSFQPGGARLAAGGTKGAAAIWDVESGSKIFSFPVHQGFVESVAFTPDGRRLVTTDDSGTVRIFVLRLEEIVALARARATRLLTDEECREHLKMDPCPELPPAQ